MRCSKSEYINLTEESKRETVGNKVKEMENERDMLQEYFQSQILYHLLHGFKFFKFIYPTVLSLVFLL